MKVRLEAARLMTYRTAWPLGQPRISLDASMTKLFVNARWSAHLATSIGSTIYSGDPHLSCEQGVGLGDTTKACARCPN